MVSQVDKRSVARALPLEELMRWGGGDPMGKDREERNEAEECHAPRQSELCWTGSDMSAVDASYSLAGTYCTSS